ncbi:hypothetical protein CT0861_09149 [Colletotrichum tofieldiae]|uniref:Uncharacterized protein n=1 Tax=Colletotrichum tofieldiae TaxID=708197 RepID=A0A166V3E4_9PEZI|nr:hypothetical protein CT0861_09149 [Colletotrichum tofieldiae]
MDCNLVWFVLTVKGVLVVFFLGRVIGGVAGWRDLPGVDEPPSTSVTKIMQNSALAAVGWRYGPDIPLQVCFQGPDASVRRSQYMVIY